MLSYIIFFIIGCILLFIIYIGGKGLGRGIEAKGKLNKEKRMNKKKSNISDELKKLDDLRKDKVISDKEFEKAKEKLLN